jgi:hypothetical protein
LKKKGEKRTFLIVMALNTTDLSRISNIYTTQVTMEAQESNENE